VADILNAAELYWIVFFGFGSDLVSRGGCWYACQICFGYVNCLLCPPLVLDEVGNSSYDLAGCLLVVCSHLHSLFYAFSECFEDQTYVVFGAVTVIGDRRPWYVATVRVVSSGARVRCACLL